MSTFNLSSDSSIFVGNTKAKIERSLLLQILVLSMLGILVYLFNGFFIEQSITTVRDSIFALAMYAAITVWVYFKANWKYNVDLVSIVFFLSVSSGFFVLGGIKGIAAFDFLNLHLFFLMMYEGKKRIVIVGFLVLFTFSLIWIQINNPEVILNRAIDNPDWMYVLNVLLRFIFSINIGVAFRNAYIEEHKQVKKLLGELQVLNSDVISQNEELKSMQEELKSNNDNLEELVNHRTVKLEQQNEKLMMYAYMNSHIFRGPISRIQGLLNLMEIEKAEDKKAELYTLLMMEVQNVDSVIKDISIVIYEQDYQLMEEIRIKVKKLYGI